MHYEHVILHGLYGLPVLLKGVLVVAQDRILSRDLQLGEEI
jgi:hypothetical protein